MSFVIHSQSIRVEYLVRTQNELYRALSIYQINGDGCSINWKILNEILFLNFYETPVYKFSLICRLTFTQTESLMILSPLSPMSPLSQMSKTSPTSQLSPLLPMSPMEDFSIQAMLEITRNISIRIPCQCHCTCFSLLPPGLPLPASHDWEAPVVYGSHNGTIRWERPSWSMGHEPGS